MSNQQVWLFVPNKQADSSFCLFKLAEREFVIDLMYQGIFPLKFCIEEEE